MANRAAGSRIVWACAFGARKAALTWAGAAAAGVMKRMRSPVGASLQSACVGAAYFLFCLLVQALTGAWRANFVAYPDEPSHFIGAVMVRDWLASGRWFTPVDFARDYYGRYPFFAVGYWPPLFALVTGLQFLVAGVGRTQALLVPAACAAASALLVFELLKRRAGVVAAACAGALYLSLPAVQTWMCAVMVDHMTACLCIAAGLWLSRYLDQPGYRNGVCWAVISACAILSKYSAAYLVVLPWFAVLLFRQGALLRKPSFLIQPVIVTLMVGPWALWTRNLALYAHPAEWPALTLARAASFVTTTFEMFPPVLMAVVVLGALALLVVPNAGGKDVGVLGLLCVGHLSLMFFSPVGPEDRFLLAPAASLLVLSFAGWAAALSRISGCGRWTKAFPASAAVLTIVFVLAHFGRYARRPQYPIRPIVEAVLNNQAWAGQRVLVPSDLEGPFIAEFVAHERRRAARILVRPRKVLARSDWFGGGYSSLFRTPEQMLEYFRRNPVRLIIWHDRAEDVQAMHERVLGEMLRQNPRLWRRAGSFGDAAGAASWAVYEYAPLRESR